MEKLDRLSRQASATRTVRLDDGWRQVRERASQLYRAAIVWDLVGLTVDELHDAGIDDLPPDIADVFSRVAPNVDIESISAYPSEGLEGLANLVKGGLFEQRVIAGLSDGELGEVTIPPGGAVELGDFTQQGFDARILDRDGSLVELVQIKASDSADLIAGHLATYPEIDQVWTTHEAAADAAARGLPAWDTGLSDLELSEHVVGSLSDQSSVSVGEVLDEILPQVTFVLIAAAWISARRSGADPVSARADAVSRGTHALLASSAAGLAAHFSGADLVRLPVALGIRVLAARGGMASRSAARLRQLGSLIDGLAADARSHRPR